MIIHLSFAGLLLITGAITGCGSDGGSKKAATAPVAGGTADAEVNTTNTTNATGTIAAVPVRNASGTAGTVTPQAAAQPKPAGIQPTVNNSLPNPSPTASSSNGLGGLVSSIVALLGNGGAGGASGVPTPVSPAAPAVTPVVMGGSSLDALRQDCLSVINQYRASIGRPALTLRASASSCLDGQAAADGASGRAHGAFGKCGESAQDECPGWGGDPADSQPKCLAAMWREGPGGGHYENMANAAYKEVSCGYAPGSGGQWMVQDFFR